MRLDYSGRIIAIIVFDVSFLNHVMVTYTKIDEDSLLVEIETGNFIISEVDKDLIRSYNWCIINVKGNKYVRHTYYSNGTNKFLYLHTVICERIYGNISSKKVLFKGDKLDLRRSNLDVIDKADTIDRALEINQYYQQRYNYYFNSGSLPVNCSKNAVKDCQEYLNGVTKVYVYRMLSAAEFSDFVIDLIKRDMITMRTAISLNQAWKRINKHQRVISLEKVYEDLLYKVITRKSKSKILISDVKEYFDNFSTRSIDNK